MRSPQGVYNGAMRPLVATAIFAGLAFLSACRSTVKDDGTPVNVERTYASQTGEPPPAPGVVERAVSVAGHERRYLLFVPPNAVKPVTLVVALHGGGGTARGLEAQSGWQALAKQRGFAVAYPQGVGKSWNDGRTDTPSEAIRENADDVGFLAALIADAGREAGVDAARVYMNGISNGAFMTSRFACERADLVSAIGLVAGTIGPDVLARCKPSRPVAVIAFNGTSDPIVPYDGGTVRIGPLVRGRAASVAESIAMWVQADGCTKEPDRSFPPDTDQDDDSKVRLDAFGGCTAEKAVHLYTIDGGGHTWPGGKQYLPPRIVGRVNRDIDATALMWSFFATH